MNADELIDLTVEAQTTFENNYRNLMRASNLIISKLNQSGDDPIVIESCRKWLLDLLEGR
jgi:hypothetical protein